MKPLISVILALIPMTVLGQNADCQVLKVDTDSTLKAYRIDRGLCRKIGKSPIELGRDNHELTLYAITGCRDIGGPTFCDISAQVLWQADKNGNCEVEVDWAVTPEGAASCTPVDR